MEKEVENIIDKIVDMKVIGNTGVGIYGRKVCQLCGQLGNFRGWAGAMAAHGANSGGPFVCGKCRIKHFATGEHSSRYDARWLRGHIAGRGWRYCEACGKEVPLPDGIDALKTKLVCSGCEEPDSRRRYMRWRILNNTKPEVLLAMAEAQKIAIERIVNKLDK